MPTGEYQVGGRVERFSCAPGPLGWRYTASDDAGGSVDLTVDAQWRQLRVEVVRGGWTIRGGVTGRQTNWVRAGGPEPEELGQRAAGFFGDSPAFLIAAARLLALEPGKRANVELVELGGDALAARLVRQAWRLVEVTEHQAEMRPLQVDQYEVTDLDTGEAVEVHLAGDVVLAAPDVELISLEGPPSE